MATQHVTWDELRSLKPSTYVWKGKLLTCDRKVLFSADRRRACELEYNARGCTVDYYLFDEAGHGTILTFSSVGNYDLLFRRIYADDEVALEHDALAWVNDWHAPIAGIDGGVLLSLDMWGNEVAV